MNLNAQKIYLLAALLLGIGINVSAQKLPSEQKDGLYAPAKMKIDGKATEWGDKFSAHNNAVGLFYSMANDDDNLYLIMRTDQYSAVKKAFYSGITLLIKSHDKSSKSPDIKMTYPLVAMTDHTEIVLPLYDKQGNMDSIVTAVNGWIGKAAKKIAIAGFTDITEPDVSVYNDLGLKAAAMIDVNRAATFELQLPLKYIRHLLGANLSFDYSITVNGLQMRPNTIIIGGSSIDNNGSHAPSAEPVNDMFTPTYLKASYTLVKK
ncbi:MAG: hypothetical protein V4592_00015 [Bacteroidota bacterium]